MNKLLPLFCLFLIFLQGCQPFLRKKPEAPKAAEGPALVVRHYLVELKDPRMRPEDILTAIARGEPERVSSFPANVAFLVSDGDMGPIPEEIGRVTKAVKGKAGLKGGLALPLEELEWKKAARHTESRPVRDERGTGFSLRFETAPVEDDDRLQLVSSFWYSEINGTVWASMTGGLVASDPSVPRTLCDLQTEMLPSQTTIYAITSPEKKFCAIAAVSLVRGNEREEKSEGKKPGKESEG